MDGEQAWMENRRATQRMASFCMELENAWIRKGVDPKTARTRKKRGSKEAMNRTKFGFKKPWTKEGLQ